MLKNITENVLFCVEVNLVSWYEPSSVHIVYIEFFFFSWLSRNKK